MTKKDSCYYSAKDRYDIFPSARASQAIAKCRKKKGQVRKTKKGAALKRWGKEKWKDQSGKPCGTKRKGTPYCRPSKRVSSKTPRTRSEMSKSQYRSKVSQKSKVGRGKRVTPVRRKRK